MSEAFYCQTQDLTIGYGKTPLLQNIGIGVQRGQILALIGPNGAGKSTLLKTLAGQLAAQGIGGGIAGVAQPKEYPQRNNGGNEDYYANRDEKDFHLSSSCAIITRVGSDRAACVVVFYLH